MHNLRRIDLNLLVAFDALMRTRHVTRAADLLGLGQSGMSSALARLRTTFGDDLLVKQGGGMAPTARAMMLEPEVRRILRDIDSMLGDDVSFEPARASRVVNLRMSDLLSRLLLPSLVARLSAIAPGISLEIVHLDPAATVEALEKNAIDLAISTKLEPSATVDCETLFEDRVVGLARLGHPAAKSLHEVDTFVALPHLRAAQSPIDRRFADDQLTRMGLSRRIAATLPHWLAMPEILARSDLIAIVPESFARKIAEPSGLTTFTPPLPETTFDWSIYWHRRHAADRGLIWMRQLIHEVAETELLR